MLRKVFFLLILVSPALWANLRAPVHIDRGGSELKGEKAALKILGETLEFQCPEAYTGKINFELFAARACDTRVRYRIFAEKDEKVKLTFVFAGTGNVTWSYRDKVGQSEAKHRTTRLVVRMTQITAMLLDHVDGDARKGVQQRGGLSFHESGNWSFYATVLKPNEKTSFASLNLVKSPTIVLAGADSRARNVDLAVEDLTTSQLVGKDDGPDASAIVILNTVVPNHNYRVSVANAGSNGPSLVTMLVLDTGTPAGGGTTTVMSAPQ